MWLQFFSQNFHFIVNLFASLVFFAIAWLYLDAWINGRSKKELCKWLGFALAGLSFFVHATIVEQSVLGESPLGDVTNTLFAALRYVGYTLIILGNIADPLQIIPANKGLQLQRSAAPKPRAARAKKSAPSFIGMSTPAIAAAYGLAIGALAIAALYWRRATTGMERHLKPVAAGFMCIGLSELVAAAGGLRESTHPLIHDLTQAFGWVWWGEQLLLLAGMVVLGRWVWGYLTKRLMSQLFMVLMSITIVIFFVVTVSFTALLLRSVRSDSLVNLRTAANVLHYAIDAKQAETQASAEQLAVNVGVVQAIAAKDHQTLVAVTKQYLADKKLSSLLVTTESGQVLLRAESADEWGDSVSSDTLIRRALLGEGASAVSAFQGALAPSMRVRSAVPVRDANNVVIGSVTTGLNLDSAFVDGVQSSTGLHSSIYAGNTLAATTVAWADGKTRSVGVKIKDAALLDTVLTHGQDYQGNIALQNRSLLAVFVPLKDADGAVQGILMVSEPQNAILRTAGRSIELTFVLTSLLLAVSIFPLYMVVRAITRQLR